MRGTWAITATAGVRAPSRTSSRSSHRNLAAAYDTGFLDDLVTPFLGLERDQNLRPDTSVEKLAKLKPVFGGEDGTMTAGNSTPLSDGASVVLLASEEWAAAHNLPVQAYVVDGQTAAIDHVHKREGLLMAPTYAVPAMLARNGLGLGDFDFYEIHEAFASQVLCTLKAWQDPVYCREKLGLDEPLGRSTSKMNTHGGCSRPVTRSATGGGSSRPAKCFTKGRPRTDLDCAAGGAVSHAIMEAPA